jgi:hypothetical protein
MHIKGNHMPLFMDVYGHIEGHTPDQVARTHTANLKRRARYGVNYLRGWFGEQADKAFCHVEASNNEATTATTHGSAD